VNNQALCGIGVQFLYDAVLESSNLWQQTRPQEFSLALFRKYYSKGC
jgi:hypothetical protein